MWKASRREKRSIHRSEQVGDARRSNEDLSDGSGVA